MSIPSSVYWCIYGKYIYMIYPKNSKYMAYRRNLLQTDSCAPIEVCYVCTPTFGCCIKAFKAKKQSAVKKATTKVVNVFINCGTYDKKHKHTYNGCNGGKSSWADKTRLSIISNDISTYYYYEKLKGNPQHTVVPIVNGTSPTGNKILFIYVTDKTHQLKGLLEQNTNHECDMYALLGKSDFSSEALASYTRFAGIKNNTAITELIAILKKFENKSTNGPVLPGAPGVSHDPLNNNPANVRYMLKNM